MSTYIFLSTSVSVPMAGSTALRHICAHCSAVRPPRTQLRAIQFQFTRVMGTCAGSVVRTVAGARCSVKGSLCRVKKSASALEYAETIGNGEREPNLVWNAGSSIASLSSVSILCCSLCSAAVQATSTPAHRDCHTPSVTLPHAHAPTWPRTGHVTPRGGKGTRAAIATNGASSSSSLSKHGISPPSRVLLSAIPCRAASRSSVLCALSAEAHSRLRRW